MKKLTIWLFCTLILPLAALSAADNPAVTPTGNGDAWLVREDARFVFIYREHDKVLVNDLMRVAEVSYRVVCGYFGFEPNEKPRVIIYGDQDTPAFGGYCGPFPLRIAISAATGYSPRTLLTHEFTHWMNAVRPTGFMHVVGSIFGRDLSFVTLGLEFHFVEGITSFLDGERSDTWNEMLYKAPLLEERMWSFEQTWTGGDSQPGPLRTYLSGMLLADYLYRHFGPDAFAKLEERFSAFPFGGDLEALRFVTGMDPRLVWTEALRESRERFSVDASRSGGINLTPQDSDVQKSWVLLQASQRGLLMARTSLTASNEFGFYRPATAAAGTSQPESWQPLTGLRDSVIGATINQSGELLVVSRAPPAFSGRDDETIAADLWVMPVTETPDGKSFSVVPRQLTRNARLTRPALSRDGSALFAIQRLSNEWRLVKVALDTGATSVIVDGTQASGTIPEEAFSVVRVDVSPDGRSLALLLSRQGTTDLAIAAIDGSGLQWVTRDPATEFAPRFAADGRILFASDRENAIVLYAYDPVTKQVFRLLRDPIAVWAGVLGGPDSASADFFYQSYTSQGYVLKRLPASALENSAIPGFGQLSPQWIKRRDAVWQELAGLAPVASMPAIPTPAPTVQPLIDIAVPVLWLPTLNLDAAGLAFGAETLAASVLGTNQWTLGAAWIPLTAQVTGQFTMAIYQPGFRLDAAAALEYHVGGSAARPNYYQDRRLTLDTVYSLYANRNPEGTDLRLDAELGGLLRWRVQNSSTFDFTKSFGLTPVFAFQFAAGLDFSLTGPAVSAAVFGGAGFEIGVQAYARPLLDAGGLAGKVSLALQIPLGLTVLRFEGNSAIDGTGQAASLVPALSTAWPIADGPWRTDGGVYWEVPFSFDITPSGPFSVEKRGLILGLASGIASGTDGTLRWDGFVVLKAEYRFWLLWTITPVPLTAGIAWRLDPSALSAGNGNLLIYFGIYGQGLSFGQSDVNPDS